MSEARNIISRDSVENDSPIGLDAYSIDGVLVGRVSGYVDEVEDDRVALELGTVDDVEIDGRQHTRRIFVDGHGYAAQALIVVPVNTLQVDLRGRRVALPLTIAQIRDLPHHEQPSF